MRKIFLLSLLLLTVGCGGGGGGGSTAAPEPVSTEPPADSTDDSPRESTDDAPGEAEPPATDDDPDQPEEPQLSDIDTELMAIIAAQGLTGDPSVGRNLPEIDSGIATLGKLLFFSKHLGGQEDVACASCHHPVLGGADQLSLPVGVDAVDARNMADADLLGMGRHSVSAGNVPLVQRNAPSVFNAGLWDLGMFWDSRVSSQGGEELANGQESGIATSESDRFRARDSLIAPGTTLPAAQARFPAASVAEMRGGFDPAGDNQSARAGLAARFDDVLSGWPALFQESFGDTTISFDRIADALGEYERSMNFVETPWKAYIQGDLDALTEEQKAGAILFYTDLDVGGADCVICHSGDRFTDEEHHIIGFPQISDDIGREGANGNDRDRYSFRTPSLINVTATAPYGHAGLYATLEEVIDHYNGPAQAVDRLFGVMQEEPFVVPDPPFCRLPQIVRMTESSGQDCASVFPAAYENSVASVLRIQNNRARNFLIRRRDLDLTEISQLAAFLEALTDPCIEDRACLDPWIVDADDRGDYPDDSALIAHDEQKLDL